MRAGKHVKVVHPSSSTDGSRGYTTLEETTLVCKVCTKSMTRNELAIRHHLKAHTITLENYHESYVAGARPEEPMPLAERPATKTRKSLPVKVKKEAVSARDWCAGCLYECAACPESTDSLATMRRHLSTVHKKSGQRRGEDYTVVRESWLDCALCGVSVPKSSWSVKVHLSVIHRVEIGDYEDRFILGGEKPAIPDPPTPESDVPAGCPWYDRCVYSCAACSRTYLSSSGIASHVVKCPYSPGVTAQTKVVSRPLFECAECGAKMYHAKIYIQKHLKNYHDMGLFDYAARHEMGGGGGGGGGDAMWFDGCRYRCEQCPRETDSLATIKRHMTTAHQMSDGGYEVLREDYVDCQKCGEDILRCGDNVRAHLRAAHGITLEKYSERYYSTDQGIQLKEDAVGRTRSLKRAAPTTAEGVQLKEASVRLRRLDERDISRLTRTAEHPKKRKSPAAKEVVAPEADFPVELPETGAWYDRCLFQCQLCKWTAWSEESVRSHVVGCRKESSREGRADAGAPIKMVLRNEHYCGACGEPVQHRLAAIRMHLATKHRGMKMAEYEERYETSCYV